MRAVTETGSKRKLTAKRLTVDWHGLNRLFYWITKSQARKIFAGATKITIQGRQEIGDIVYPLEKEHTEFNIVKFNGCISIGCESFTKAEVKELKQWSKK